MFLKRAPAESDDRQRPLLFEECLRSRHRSRWRGRTRDDNVSRVQGRKLETDTGSNCDRWFYASTLFIRRRSYPTRPTAAAHARLLASAFFSRSTWVMENASDRASLRQIQFRE